MYDIAIQHGEKRSLAEVFRATTLQFRAFGNREFVSLELSEYIKRLAAFGPSDKNLSKAKRRRGNCWHDWPTYKGPQRP